MQITIDPEFKALIPPLSAEELQQLEKNILADGCRDPLVLWGSTLVDGHNRHEICTRNGIKFEVVDMVFNTRADARVWIRRNQKGRRNLSAAWIIELELGNKADLLELGREKQTESGKETGRGNAKVLSQNDNTFTEPEPKHDTRAKIAKAAGVSTGQVGMAEQVKKKDPILWEKAKAGEVSISSAYKEIKKEEKKEERREKIEAIKESAESKPVEDRVRIIHGDLFDVIRQIENGSIDLLNTDPPYNVLEEGWDTFKSHESFMEFSEKWLVAVMPKIKPSGRAFISMAPDFKYDFWEILKKHNMFGMSLGNEIVWVKRNNNKKFSQERFRLTYEPIFYLYGKDAGKLNFDENTFGETQTDVWEIATPQSNFKEGKYHPAQKPIELYRRIVSVGSMEGDTVLDCFAGSGTTGIACKETFRKCILIEIDEENIKLIKGRL